MSSVLRSKLVSCVYILFALLILCATSCEAFLAPSRPSLKPAAALTPILRLHFSAEHDNNSNNLPTPLRKPTSIPTTTSNSQTPTLSPRLSPLEVWCVTHMDVWYSRSLSIKCPFMKRRMADFLDGVDMVMRFLLIRHKSLHLIDPPPGCRSLARDAANASGKRLHLPMEERLEMIENDWKPHNHKGYYITGRLTPTIYRDDCLFNGPDPDMPVRGLRKYLNAASQLFDYATSTAELLSLETVDVSDDSNNQKVYREDTISPSCRDENSSGIVIARWRLQGVLHLPWHPELPVWTGETVYHFDNEGLIYLHEESWDISVWQAFAETLSPHLASRIWKKDEHSASTSQ